MKEKQSPSENWNSMMNDLHGEETLTKDNWLMISESSSDDGRYTFVHHSTANVVELKVKEENCQPSSIWFDYHEWAKFIKFIKELE